VEADEPAIGLKPEIRHCRGRRAAARRSGAWISCFKKSKTLNLQRIPAEKAGRFLERRESGTADGGRYGRDGWCLLLAFLVKFGRIRPAALLFISARI